MAAHTSVDMETGEETTINPVLNPSTTCTTTTTSSSARRPGASKSLLVSIAFIAAVAVAGCALAVVAVTGKTTMAGGSVATQSFVAHKASTQYEAGAQRIIGQATHHLTMHPACMQSAANHKVRKEEERGGEDERKERDERREEPTVD
jgi:hypothetical protein